MDRIKHPNKLISIGLSLVMLLLALGSQIGYAEDPVSMQDLRSEPGTLVVETKHTDEDKVTLISGIELTIFQVASLSVKNGDARYSLTDDFKDADVDFDGLTADASLAAAKTFEKMAGEKGLKGKTVVSANGVADFGTVNHGIYLVCQTGTTGDALEYTELDPYLVMTPQRSLDDETAWEYDVVSIPKLGIVNKEIKLTKKVNEQDNIEVEIKTDKFAYDIGAALEYSPENFAVIDNVPEELEIVDKDQIEITINDQIISKEERDAMLTIDGNTVRVDFTKEQIEQWYPLKMNVRFICKFSEGVDPGENGLNIENVAGFEVDGTYYEPPGDDHKAEVKGVTEDEVKGTVADRIKKRVKTGDYTTIGLWVGLLAAAMIVILLLARRKRNNQN